MNRIVLIGNGFDKAHGLKTGYRDFMDWYWDCFASDVCKNGMKPYEDNFVRFSESLGNTGRLIPTRRYGENSYKKFKRLVRAYMPHRNEDYNLHYKNNFFLQISEKNYFENWLDIENEYYTMLKSNLNVGNNKAVKKLNDEFCQVKELLEEYLTEVCKKELPRIEPDKDIKSIFLGKGIESRCVALAKQESYVNCLPEWKQKMSEMIQHIVQYEDEHSEQKKLHAMMARIPYQSNPLCSMNEEERKQFIDQATEQFGIVPDHTLVLNFNYTSTFETLYAPEFSLIQIINIHGELNNDKNPIIFGYGDELDDDYREIEKTHDPDFLENIKSIHYHNTSNYRRLQEFLKDEPYQVFVMGHSCGNSDRTLLNTIFEDSNCVSLMPFYYQWKDEKTGKIEDNYTDMVKNISRNFNDKQNLRDMVVNKEYCMPLVPWTEP